MGPKRVLMVNLRNPMVGPRSLDGGVENAGREGLAEVAADPRLFDRIGPCSGAPALDCGDQGRSHIERWILWGTKNVPPQVALSFRRARLISFDPV